MGSQFQPPVMPVPLGVPPAFRSTEYFNQLGLQPHVKTESEVGF